MASGTPVIQQVSRLSLVPQIAIVVIVCLTAQFYLGTGGVFIGLIIVLSYSYGSRYFVPGDHRRGISLVKQKKFAEAIDDFEKSVNFFDRHSWLDRYRAVVMMSSSAASYTEMGLFNIGFCHLQMGDGVKARQAYEHCLQRFPDSGLATAALRMMDASARAVENEKSDTSEPT